MAFNITEEVVPNKTPRPAPCVETPAVSTTPPSAAELRVNPPPTSILPPRADPLQEPPAIAAEGVQRLGYVLVYTPGDEEDTPNH